MEFRAWAMEGSPGRPGSTDRVLAVMRSRTEGQGGPRFHGGEQLRRRSLLTCGRQGAIPAKLRHCRGLGREGELGESPGTRAELVHGSGGAWALRSVVATRSRGAAQGGAAQARQARLRRPWLSEMAGAEGRRGYL